MTSITRKPMTRKEVKRYLFAGDAHITMYNNISKNTLNFNVFYCGGAKYFQVSSPSFEAEDVYFIGIVKPNCLWRLEPSIMPPSKINSSHKGWFVFSWLIRMLSGIESERNDVEITINSNRCSSCGKRLTDHKSLIRGLGPHCWKEVMEKEKKEEEDEKRRNASAERFYWEILFPSHD